MVGETLAMAVGMFRAFLSCDISGIASQALSIAYQGVGFSISWEKKLKSPNCEVKVMSTSKEVRFEMFSSPSV